jgi:hypothetical protein
MITAPPVYLRRNTKTIFIVKFVLSLYNGVEKQIVQESKKLLRDSLDIIASESRVHGVRIFLDSYHSSELPFNVKGDEKKYFYKG